MSCSTCDYAANSERAASLPSRDVPHTADDVVVQLFGPSDPLAHGATLTAVITPRRRERNPLKVGKHLLPDSRELKDGANEWDWKDRPEGPLVRYESVRLLVDFECAGLDNDDLEEAMLRSILAYAAPPDKASLPPSAEGPSLADFFPNQLGDEVAPLPLQLVDARTAEEGDTCPRCRKGHLHSTKAIEVGHTFLLGTKYSEALDATFAAQPEPAVGGSKSAAPARKHFQMGCYGLGITRLLGAIAQRAFDKRGFVWPESIAPFSAVVLPSSPATSEKTAAAERLCAALERGISRNAIYGHDATDAPEKLEGSGEEEAVLCARDDVAVDDRYTLSMGVRLKDAELVGYPLVFVLGKHWEKTGEVEIQYRRTGTKAYVPLEKLL